ncbi:hypothetical protein [Halopseudomonas pelagia]|uniref:hypothetical protein n=1 Tax=Halopseudomonas pelagia TaxID=553151 RepID=UPI00039B0370|nr:hypothetical protein [Halopseudomonas pelagia]|tara:strand:+ start:59 stop:436 length:378 start_codon:yes stop_codon:yes gene_type:complete
MTRLTYLLVTATLLLPGVACAQYAPQVSDNPMDIIGDPGLDPGERIQRATALLNSLADVHDNSGDLEAADQLRNAAYTLTRAPHNREASELAVQAVMAAEQGALAEAQVLAESAAALSPDWAPPN